MKRLWLVSIEVYAEDAESAMRMKGRVYRVEEAAREYQPEEVKKIGFKSHGRKKGKKIE